MPFCVPSEKSIEKEVKKAITDLEAHQKQQGFDIKRAVKVSDFKQPSQRNTNKDKDKVVPQSSTIPVILSPHTSEDTAQDSSNETSTVTPILEANNSLLAAAEDAAVSPHIPTSTASPTHLESNPQLPQNSEKDSLKIHRSSSLIGHLPAINEGRKVMHPLIHSEPARSSIFHPATSNRILEDDPQKITAKGKKKTKKKKASSALDLKANNTDLETQLISKFLEEIESDDEFAKLKPDREMKMESPKTIQETNSEQHDVTFGSDSFLDSFHNNMVRSMDRSKPSKMIEEKEIKGGSELQLMSDLLQELGEDITIDAAPVTARQSTDIAPPTARGNYGSKRGSVEISKPQKFHISKLDVSKTKDHGNSVSDLLAEFD